MKRDQTDEETKPDGDNQGREPPLEDGGPSNLAKVVDAAVQRRVAQRIEAAVGQSTAAIPVEEEIAKTVRGIRRTDAYRALIHAGTAQEIQKFWRRIFVVLDQRSRWVAAGEMDKADAEGIRRLGHFLKGFEAEVQRTVGELGADWAKGLVEDAAALVAVAAKERVNTILELEVIKYDGGS